MPGESVIAVNGVELGVEEFGRADDPAILLIGGASSSMDWWDVGFCELLADGGRRVIRYDLRDTGVSTSYPPGQPGYTGADLVEDAVELIRALHLEPVHLLGISMGGGIAQQIAIRYPKLVATLTLLSTSPGGPGNGDDDLPAMSPALAQSFAEESPSPDWTDAAEVGQYFVDFERLFSGTIPVDEPRIRSIAGDVVRRSRSLASAGNHWMVGGEGGGEPRERLADITAPTLVIHGTLDPLFPLGHGEALALEIPGARLLPIEGMGHQVPPPPTWAIIVPSVLEHTGG